jgi:hypothetical protein
MDVSNAKRLMALKDESGKPKRMLEDAMLGNSALRNGLSKRVEPDRQT